MCALRCGRGRHRSVPPALQRLRSVRVALVRISRHLRPGCPSVGGPLTVTFSPRIECAVLALHRRCEKKVQRKGRAVHRPFKARRAVRPSAASGRSVRLGTAEVRLPLEPRALSRQGSAWPANLSRSRPRSKPCSAGLSGYHRQMPATFSPTRLWPNPSIERTFQKPLRAFWPAAHLQRSAP